MLKQIFTIIKAVSAIALMLAGAAAVAQTSSFEQIANQALATHPAVLSKLSSSAAAKAELEGAQWQRYPTPSLEANTDDSGTRTSLLRVQQPLWAGGGGRIDAGIDAANSRHRAAETAIGEAKQEIVLRVIAAFVDAMRQHGPYLVRRQIVQQGKYGKHGFFLVLKMRQAETGYLPGGLPDRAGFCCCAGQCSAQFVVVAQQCYGNIEIHSPLEFLIHHLTLLMARRYPRRSDIGGPVANNVVAFCSEMRSPLPTSTGPAAIPTKAPSTPSAARTVDRIRSAATLQSTSRASVLLPGNILLFHLQPR